MPYLLALITLLIIPNNMAWCQNDAHNALRAEIAQLQNALAQHKEQSNYIVIDTQNNTLEIRSKSEVLHQATCATGSGKILLHPNKQDRWQFTTPQGLWHVQRKVKDPIWAKPVWAFVETGETVPTLPWEFRRLDQTTLGAYALELGDGYEIHGTLYPALLGRNITHGCIRLNDSDLETTYHQIKTGSRVYIY